MAWVFRRWRAGSTVTRSSPARSSSGTSGHIPASGNGAPTWCRRPCSIAASRAIFGLAAAPHHEPEPAHALQFPNAERRRRDAAARGVRLCEAGIVPIMLVHDGILLEETDAEKIEHAKEIMRAAGRDVCDGFEIGVDVDQMLDRRSSLSRQATRGAEDVGDDHGHARGDRRPAEEGDRHDGAAGDGPRQAHRGRAPRYWRQAEQAPGSRNPSCGSRCRCG